MGDRMKRLRILVVGVGGQGSLTAARIIGHGAGAAGHNVTVGQLHGMSQRGGSVEGAVLIGPGKGAFISPGGADIVIGFEPLETLRALPKFSPAAKVLMNTAKIMPRVLVMEGRPYPEMSEILGQIEAGAAEVRTLDAQSLSEEVGEPRTVSTVMIGALAGLGWLGLDEETLTAAVSSRVPPRFREVNERAFALGKAAVGDPAKATEDGTG